jgi:putative peptidoglycan lipid II flippase
MRSLLRAGVTVSGLTFLSRITGLIRDTLIARLFGASALTDAFWVAFRIPNLLRRLFAEGAFSQAFVPILGQVSASEDAQHSHRLLDHVASILALSLLLISILGVVVSPVLVWLMGSGLSNSPDAQHAAVTMTRIMFPYIFCMSLVAFASGVLNVWRHFLIPAFTPVLLNVAMVLSSWLLTPYLPASVPAIRWAVGRTKESAAADRASFSASSTARL